MLQLNDAKKYFGNLTVLNGISFTVQEGEILGIAGPNGAGKTTLFNVITGLLPLTAGEIIFQEKKISKLKPYQICNLGIARTYQTPVIFPTLSVRENIKVGAVFGNRGLSAQAAAQVVAKTLEELDIADLASSFADNLNLYQKKLVMLAATLATQPRLLLLDEPAAGLPQAEIERFMQTVFYLNRERKITILIIEHLIDWLRSISGRMLIIHNGNVMALGTPEEVVNDPSVVEIYLGRGHGEPGN
jgi:branched-chain amino acid transport system ATP-binding protein